MSLLYTLWCGLLILRATNGKVSFWCNIFKSPAPLEISLSWSFYRIFSGFLVVFYRSPAKIP